MTRQLFLPGAGGSPLFWRGVADRLPAAWPRHLFGWPGLGDEPHDPGISGLDDLVALVVAQLDGPCDLLAQSMGGLVALRVALAHPDKVRRLVLTGTSGGIDVAGLGGADWRADYRAAYPRAAPWIMEVTADHSDRIGAIAAPALLLWGDADPISPLAVGQKLRALLPRARLEVVPGGAHDFVETHAAQIAPLIERFLTAD